MDIDNYCICSSGVCYNNLSCACPFSGRVKGAVYKQVSCFYEYVYCILCFAILKKNEYEE